MNLISGNAGAGVELDGSSTYGNLVEGNFIGTNLAGNATLPNSGAGVLIVAGPSGNAPGAGAPTNNTIGGFTTVPGTGAGNLISGNTGDGVEISGTGTTGNVVAGNLIGTNVTGNAVLGNGSNGVQINSGAAGNTVGGITTLARNVISGNGTYGVEISSAGTGNVVAGDYIGTDALGGALLENAYHGILIQSTPDTVVGVPGAGNVITANVYCVGVFVLYSSGTVIQSNKIGTTADGTAVLAGQLMGNGIVLGNAPDSLVGGTTPGDGNVIALGPWSSAFVGNNTPVSGFPFDADAIDVISYGGGTNVSAGSVIEGNLIGTDVTGTVALGNPNWGIGLINVSGIQIGGTAAGAGNVIAGGGEGGIDLLGGTPTWGTPASNDFGSSDNLIEGNYIGVNFDSQGNLIAGLGNGGPLPGLSGTPEAGIYLNDPTDPLQTSSGNTIGGTAAGAANIISGNIGGGIVFAGGSVTENLVEGNSIGTNLQGTAAVANTGDGVQITGGATNNTIGGLAATTPGTGAGNLISGNTGAGVEISGPGTTGTVVAGNLIGTDVTGVVAIANYAGVEIDSGASGNLIGASGTSSVNDPLERNILSGNSFAGVWLTGVGTDQNIVAGDYIGTTVTGDTSLGNGQATYYVQYGVGVGGGVVIDGAASDNLIGTSGQSADDAGERNVISGNLVGSAVTLYGSGIGGNVIAGDYLGTNAGGTAALGNANDGVMILFTTETNWIGVNPVYGPENADEGNVISGNSINGVSLLLTSNEVISGNLIGTGVSGSYAVPNQGYGIRVCDTSSIVVGTDGQDGAADAIEGNVISGNANNGITIFTQALGAFTNPSAANNVIAGNKIGTNASGTSLLANSYFGILMQGGTDNVIGLPGAGNIIGAASSLYFVAVLNASGTVIQANRIGTTADGMALLAPQVPYQTGILIQDAPDTLIGGTQPGDANVIDLGPWMSADANLNEPVAGVPWVSDAIDVITYRASTTASAGTVIEGNFIGTNATGTAVLGNPNFGVGVVDASDVTIGGTAAGAGNVIAGNGQGGIAIFGGGVAGYPASYWDYGAYDDVIEGNYIGVNFDAHGNLISGLGNGGPLPGLSGATEAGIFISDPTDPAQTTSGNTIGGTAAGAGNIISGNQGGGIVFAGGSVTGNLVEGNFIGTNLQGTAAVANTGDGVLITGGATNNTIGGITATPGTGAGNLISGNTGVGVEISGTGTTGNVVAGNLIGTEVGGEAALPNSGNGVQIDGGASRNTIGGAAAGAGNLISGNSGSGVYIFGAGTTGNMLAGDYIGTNVSGSAILENSGEGILIYGSSNNVIGVPGAGNLIAANFNGVGIFVEFSSGTVIQGNKLGTTADGMALLSAEPMGEGEAIALGNAPDTLVGGATPGDGNLISIGPWQSVNVVGNTPVSGFPFVLDAMDVISYGGGTDVCAGTVIEGNLFGTNATGTLALGNPCFDIGLINVSDIQIGGTTAGAANVIAAGGEGGIDLLGGTPTWGTPASNDFGSSDDLIEGNLIGVNFDPQGNLIAGLGNGGPLPGLPGAPEAGIYINDPTDPLQTSSGNTIGGTAAGAGNIISGNQGGGIVFAGGDVTGNLVEGNFIGTNLQGNALVANTGDGVLITGGATNNTVGGLTATPGTGAGNLISGNTGDGVDITGTGTTGTVVAGNLIGLNAAGTGPLGNAATGVAIAAGASGNLIGGPGLNDGRNVDLRQHRPRRSHYRRGNRRQRRRRQLSRH